MPTLPSSSDFNGATVTKGGFRTATAQLLSFLSGLLGTSGLAVDARNALGLGGLLINYVNRGAWVTGTAYNLNDQVQQSGTWYVCNVAHTSGTFAADLAAGYWVVFQGVTANALAASTGATLVGYGTHTVKDILDILMHGIPTYDATTAYLHVSFVLDPLDGNTYISTANSTGVQPSTDTTHTAWRRWAFTDTQLNALYLTSAVANTLYSPLPDVASRVKPAVRQTALYGPVDTNGLPNFLPGSHAALSITSQNLSSTTPLIVTAANGFDATSVDIDRVSAPITANITWGSLSDNSTNFLGLDIAADGTVTEVSTTVAPTTQQGGTYSTSANKFTFNYGEMVGKVGNGSGAANQVYRVFVGEAVCSGGSVTSTVCYAYRGRAELVTASTLPSSGNATIAHRIGPQIVPNVEYGLYVFTANNGWSVGDIIWRWIDGVSGVGDTQLSVGVDKANITYTGGGVDIQNKSSGGTVSAGASNFKMIFRVSRGW